jgi:hypothetical protein
MATIDFGGPNYNQNGLSMSYLYNLQHEFEYSTPCFDYEYSYETNLSVTVRNKMPQFNQFNSLYQFNPYNTYNNQIMNGFNYFPNINNIPNNFNSMNYLSYF